MSAGSNAEYGAVRTRARCGRLGHKWKAWSPGGDPFCARLFCKAKAKGHHSAMIALFRSALGDEPGRIGTERVSKW